MIPTTMTAAWPWLQKFIIVVVIFVLIKIVFDYFIFPELPGPVQAASRLILALVFFILFMGIMFGLQV